MRALLVSILVASAFAFSPPLLFGQTVVAPNANAAVEGGGNNSFPFNVGSFVTSSRYQQVYLASQFGTLPLTGAFITQITFRPDADTGAAFSSTLPSVQLNLSTTGTSPSTLSATFASNVGANDQVVFGPAPLSLSSSFTGPVGGPKSFDIVINLTTPFFYNPSLGNLLLDVRVFNYGGMTTTPFDFDAANVIGNASTVQSGVGSPTADFVTTSGGLVTQFTFAAVPEPSSLALLALAGLFVCLAVRYVPNFRRG